MKRYKIAISLIANAQMNDVFSYISNEFQNPLASLKLKEKLTEGIKSLSTLPRRYKLIGTKFGEANQIRRMRIKNYYIYYKIFEDKSLILICRVIYVKRNQSSI